MQYFMVCIINALTTVTWIMTWKSLAENCNYKLIFWHLNYSYSHLIAPCKAKTALSTRTVCSVC